MELFSFLVLLGLLDGVSPFRAPYVGSRYISKTKYKASNHKDLPFKLKQTITLLREASVNRTLKASIVNEGMTYLIENIKNEKPLSMDGTWALLFSSKLTSGYLPVYEECKFTDEYTIESRWGPISFGRFRGPSRVTSLNPLIVEFVNTEYTLGSFLKIPLKNQKYKSYTFYYNDDFIAVAKSSSGGLSLLKKVSNIVS